MTNTPRFSAPINNESKTQRPDDTIPERPKAEQVSPSRHGEYLRALEKKGEKKESKKSSSSTEASEESEAEEGTTVSKDRKSLFELASARRAKGDGGGSSQEGDAKDSDQNPDQSNAAAEAAAAAQRLSMTTPTHSKPDNLSISGKLTDAKKRSLEMEAAALIAAESEMKAKTVMPEIAKEGTTETAKTILADIIKQTVEALSTLVSKDLTNLTITVRYPPTFEGATISLTEYSSAPKQFNITFANLSPDARRLIETISNQQHLKQALVDKGYVIQNIIIDASTPRRVEQPSQTEKSKDQGAYRPFGGQTDQETTEHQDNTY